MTDLLAKLAYQTVQYTKSSFALTHKTFSSRLLNLFYDVPGKDKLKPLSPELLETLQTSLARLLETEWKDAERGIYPVELLFDNPWEDFLSYYPALLLDLPRLRERSVQQNYRDFAKDLDTDNYPNYYRRNFHFQTDGYFSDLSANLYDLQVEILFNGCADAMRRRVLAPLKQGLEAGFPSVPARDLRILDIACGTGRTLKFLRATIPQANLFGVDLSTAYLRKAAQLLGQLPGELPQLVGGKVEELPYRGGYFHAATSVFLFHELPGTVRQRAIEECFRVIKPGGWFVICDSIQLGDVPEWDSLLHNFPISFHEPYYNDYIRDDLERRLHRAGFGEVYTQMHHASKYWVARKPQIEA
ncbi:MAG: class I SAM-dependent methyltransferase [Cyanobacteria bacterium J007]|nr:MAG: class I SAM-dependent methyltransferase [Cyanobacteria bacterium J007]